MDRSTVLLLQIGFLATSTMLKAVAQTTVEVEKDACYWRVGSDYAVDSELELNFEKAVIKEGKLPKDDKVIKPAKPTSFKYHGQISHVTKVPDDTPEDSGLGNGRVMRTYGTVEMAKIESSMGSIQVDANWWERRFSRHPKGLKYNARESGNGVAILDLTPELSEEMFNQAGIMQVANQTFSPLSGKVVFMDWEDRESISKENFTLRMGRQKGGGWEPEDGSVNKDLSDAIVADSKLLYANFVHQGRQPGDTWILPADQLTPFLHPQFKGRFKGQCVVMAERIKETSPHNDLLPFSGIKLAVVESARINGKRVGTKFSLEGKTADDKGFYEVSFIPNRGNLTCEIWLDNTTSAVRYALIKLEKQPYDGKMPKVGDLAEDLDITAEFELKLEYKLRISKSE